MPVRYTQKEFGYFVTKYQRRLYRQLMQYQTLKAHLPQTIRSQAQNICELLDISEGIIDNIEIKDHVEKSCLIGLKAEFELFFYVFCLYIVDKILSDAEREGHLAEEHEGILRCIESIRSYYEEFVKGGFRNPKQLFINKAMPQHGLDRMVRFLATCGVDVLPLLRGMDGAQLNEYFGNEVQCRLRPFSQLRMAFQVRHAIEHSFSKVGDSFLNKIGNDWKYSSWHRQFAKSGLDLGTRILVDHVDISATAASMSQVAQLLENCLQKFAQNGKLD